MSRRTIRVAGFALLCSIVVIIVGIAGRTSAQGMTFVRVGSIEGPADRIELQGTRAYIGGERTFAVVDVSTPAAPKKLGTYTFPEKIWSFRVVGSLAYVADDFFGLGILDVSNPAAPGLRGSFKTPGQAKSVALFGTKAVIADHMSGLDHLDVSDPVTPVSLGSFYLEGYARDVVASGAVAFAVDAPAGLYVFDLSKPGPLDAVSSLQSASTPASITVSDESTRGPRLAVVAGAGMLQIYDVSNPAMPVKTAAFRTAGARPNRVRLRGSTAYVADGPGGLQVVDLSTPSTPSLIGTYATPDTARDVALADSLVYVVIGPPPTGNIPGGGGEVLILRQQ
jgi:hypothetical protein